jgi:hypothetical protein
MRPSPLRSVRLLSNPLALVMGLKWSAVAVSLGAKMNGIVTRATISNGVALIP